MSTATVTSCQCFSSHESRCEKLMMPAAAPTTKITMTGTFRSPTACMMNWYLPSSSRMKAPEMPGRIIAQMAIAPESRINHHVSGVSAGVATVIHHAAAAPIRHAATVCTRQRPICLATSSAEATIRPKKNDQMAIGWFVSR